MMKQRFPRYGAKSIWTFVKVRGHVLPVVAADDQYCVRFPDGSVAWVEKWDCDSAFPDVCDDVKRDKAGMKERARRRLREGASWNTASTEIEIDLAFERNAGKFED